MCCCQLYEELALEEHKMNLYGGLEMARQLQQQASGGGGGGGGQDNLVFERTEEEGAQEGAAVLSLPDTGDSRPRAPSIRSIRPLVR